jgi:hypothetical protein
MCVLLLLLVLEVAGGLAISKFLFLVMIVCGDTRAVRRIFADSLSPQRDPASGIDLVQIPMWAPLHLIAAMAGAKLTPAARSDGMDQLRQLSGELGVRSA